MSGTILYISSVLPARSETFVYREIFALRSLGLPLRTASVRRPERELGSPELEALAAGAIPVYWSGLARLALDASLESLGHPLRALSTLGLSLRDALEGADLSLVRRLKVPVQALAALALSRRVRPLRVVHIHAHMANVPTTIAMYAARQLGIGFSFTGHANDLFPSRALLREKIERASFVNCISLWHRSFYESVARKDAARLPVVRCGIDTARELPLPAAHGEALRILSVGRLVAKKGFDVLIEAAGMAAAACGCRVELTIAGSGPEEGNLRALAARLGPGASVEMMGGLDNSRVMELMAGCELFALPLRVTGDGDRDGIPVVLMEAMARGRCAISGDLPAIRELIEDGSTGFLVPPGNARALAALIGALASDRARLDAIGERARRRIVEEFDLSLNARRMLAALRAAGIDVPRAPG